MGWVGVVIFIAAACYFLRRYPRDVAESQPSASTPSRAPTTEDVKNRDIEPESPQGVESPSIKENNNTSQEEEGQRTPKASLPSALMAEVPTLRLDGDEADSNAGAPTEQSGQQQRQPVPVPVLIEKENERPCTADSVLMPPPPLPASRLQSATQQQRQLGSNNSLNRPPTGTRLYPPRPTSSPSSTLQPPPSAASSLRAPPNNRLTGNGTLSPAQLVAKPSKPSRKVILEPGYSPLDWAALTSNPNNNLRGANLPRNLIRVTPSMLKVQNGRKGRDAWTSYQGKVYNITPYLPFHPGGKGELMRGAGKDSGKLFTEVHPWVNWDAMLGECLVGILVTEHEGREQGQGNELDAMD